MSHTPGSWDAVDDEIVAKDGDVGIAHVPLCDGTDPTEWQANIHLIAAAPEMLQALKETIGYWDACGFSDCDDGCDCVVQSVQAAIAKAEGR